MKLLPLFAGFMVVVAHGNSQATPWAAPGDQQLRRDIETLAAYGVIEGPITIWPIPWSQISSGMSSAPLEALPPHVVNALLRVRARLPKSRDYRSFGFDVETVATNQPRLVRGFEGGAREDADVKLSADRHFSSSYIRLSVGYRNDDRDRDFQFDDSYVAKALGNWVVYGGFVDQWWGPGQTTALILSTNARPMPKVGLMRLNPKPFRTEWLSWIGPWQINVFAARQADDRNDFAHSIIAGIRVTASPIRGLSIGLSRAMQLCGAGRPCGFSIWKNALIGLGDADNRPDQPGNQLAAIDVKYARAVGKYDFSVYGELLGEDEDNIIIDKFAVMAGASLGGATSSGETSWNLSLEFSDTKGSRVIGRGIFPGVVYNHGLYTDGYRDRDRSLGGSLDSDARLLTVSALASDASDRSYWLKYHHAEINDLGINVNPLSFSAETMNIVEGGTSLPTRFGVFSVSLRAADDQVNTPGQKDFEAAAEIGWKTRF